MNKLIWDIAGGNEDIYEFLMMHLTHEASLALDPEFVARYQKHPPPSLTADKYVRQSILAAERLMSAAHALLHQTTRKLSGVE